MGAEFVERFLGGSAGGEEGVDPGEVDEAEADFEAAGPVEAGEGWIRAAPIVEPFDAFVLRGFVMVQPAGHGEADEFEPAAQVPNDFDVGAVGEGAVIDFEGGF